MGFERQAGLIRRYLVARIIYVRAGLVKLPGRWLTRSPLRRGNEAGTLRRPHPWVPGVGVGANGANWREKKPRPPVARPGDQSPSYQTAPHQWGLSDKPD